MTISFTAPSYPVDPDGFLSGTGPRSFVYRVGDTAILAGGAYIGGYNDDGEAFQTRQFADDSGLGLGRLTTFHVHDNGDGTMNVYYQIRDADPLPTTISNWVVTLDADTGRETGAATEITSGVFGNTDQDMLQRAFDLPDGNIAVIQALPNFSAAHLIIARADGTEIGRSDGAVGANVFDLPATYDLAVVGDRLLVTWVETDAGAARQTHMRFFTMDGQTDSDTITVSRDISSGFGVPAGVQAEALSNGNFVVVWVEALDSGEDADGTSVWFRIFDADGDPQGGRTRVGENTEGNQDNPLLVATEDGFIIGYTAFEFSPSYAHEGRLFEFDNDGREIDQITTDAYLEGSNDLIRTDNNTALLINNEVHELILPGADTPLGGDTGPDPITGNGRGNTLRGTNRDDVIEGLGGNDRLIGRRGNDDLDGGGGRDTLVGNGGRDRLDGGGGNDQLRGGGGADVFVFSNGADTARDFRGNDQIDVSDVRSIRNFRDLSNNHIEERGSDVIIDDGRGNSLTLQETSIDDLRGNDFIF